MPAGAASLRFEEIGEKVGAHIQHHTRTFSGPHADVLGMFTSGGATSAVGDYDGDGDEDLYVTDSEAGKPGHLLRNQLVETGKLAFVDVTAEAGVGGGNDAKSIVSDALWLDADNDGALDLLLARFGTPVLYRNEGKGKFKDVSAGSGLDEFANTITAITFDYDKDGRLDLLLGNYFPPVNLIDLPTPHVLPNNLDQADNGGGASLWRNVSEKGKIGFVEVTEKAGLSHHKGWTLDAGHADLDNDGWQDIYLAGDYGTDRLFWNNGDGTFRDATREAVGIDTRKGMNVDVADYDRDGQLDIYVTNITDEYMKECNMLWHNNGDRTFSDLSKETGTCNTLWGWAAKFGDFDNDGWEDLFVVNGLRSAGPENFIPVLVEMIVTPDIDFTDVRNWPAIGDRTWSGYQKKKLFRNLGDQSFKEVAAQAGVDNDRDGRGIGMADFDQDGRLDLYQTNVDQPALFYRNVTEGTGNWLALKLVGTKSNRDAIGARVTVRSNGQTWIREVNGGNGYAGQSSTRLHFGLGSVGKIDAVEIRWPSGKIEKVTAPLNRITVIRESNAAASPQDERLWHHRNLGKAFYENPTTQYEAVEELKKALDLAPGSPRERLNYALALLKAGKTAEGIKELEAVQKQAPEIPHTWFNLGIAFKQDSQYEKALQQFERMAALVPDEPITQYNLGVLYKLTEKPDLALHHFERAAQLDSYFAAPRFQLYNSYRKAGRTAEAQARKQEYDAIKEAQKGAAIPEDVDWSWYSELLDEIDPPAEAAAPVEPSFEVSELGRGIEGLTVFDADGDLVPDLLAWSKAGVSGANGLENLRNVTAVAAGDFDNDGLADLCVLADAPMLYRNVGGSFQRVNAKLPAGRFHLAFWLDFDHDYDLDLILMGEGAALARNNGTGWSDETKRFPFVSGRAVSGAIIEAVADTQGMDLAVTYAGRPAVLYRDRLGGHYEAVELPGLDGAVLAYDVDQDGWSDLLSSSLWLNRRSLQGVLEKAELSLPALPLAFADLEGRGMSDLVAGDGVHRNEGRGKVGAAKAAPAIAAASADFDGDGREDLAVVGNDGVLRRLLNRTKTDHHWLRIGLEGVKNLKLAPGAEVEVKAGASYQKKVYHGFPLTFGLGPRTAIDAVRITWPNGLIQNETRQAADRAVTFKEAPRLSGSCPMIFTWNGERFQFITDVLGVAPLGASAGDGEYFPVDHDEYVQIPGEALAEVDGRYEIRVTEELREVAYLDQMRLIALDHPVGVEVFTNDKFKAPPFPEFRLFGVEERIYPVRATDHHGKDVLPRLLARDQTYPDGFRRDLSGVAELHHLDLDFGSAAEGGRAVLVLSGWVDWADGSTFLGAAQAMPAGLVFPRLQVKDGQGRWQTVIEDMGLPAGKPKTIAVDLTGRFLSSSREVRIETSLCLYWDEIFLSEESGEPPVEITGLAPSLAELRYRGFSRPVIHPERRQPESFDYHSWMPVSMWNPTPGLYTRYGDVRPLLEEVDDRLLVMGSGDEVRLLFDAKALPPLAPGWRRDFLLLVDGWAKDGDANTAFSQTVEPLPFHGMSQYPYPEGESFPGDEPHRLYRERYNTRPALRLLRPLR
ncbi:MAG: hypothetical protein QOH06_700 [Acidobacteriota bacterium]|nr:hypothetical protein [Acidobacteriota bacterium]